MPQLLAVGAPAIILNLSTRVFRQITLFFLLMICFAARADPSIVCGSSITLLRLSFARINEILSSKDGVHSLPRI